MKLSKHLKVSRFSKVEIMACGFTNGATGVLISMKWRFSGIIGYIFGCGENRLDQNHG
jgi:hexokinase